MAYLFNGSTQYLSCTTTPVTGPPFTISSWINPAARVTDIPVIALTNNSNAERHNIVVLTAGTVTVSSTGSNGVFYGSTSTELVPTNTWSNVVGVYRTTSNRQGYLNGFPSVLNNNTSNPVIGRMQIATRFLPGPFGFFNGSLAEIGIWSAALDDAEIASLSVGVSPILIRPQSLVFYAPLIRNISDIRNARAITNNNTATATTHPRIYL